MYLIASSADAFNIMVHGTHCMLRAATNSQWMYYRRRTVLAWSRSQNAGLRASVCAQYFGKFNSHAHQCAAASPCAATEIECRGVGRRAYEYDCTSAIFRWQSAARTRSLTHSCHLFVCASARTFVKLKEPHALRHTNTNQRSTHKSRRSAW